MEMLKDQITLTELLRIFSCNIGANLYVKESGNCIGKLIGAVDTMAYYIPVDYTAHDILRQNYPPVHLYNCCIGLKPLDDISNIDAKIVAAMVVKYDPRNDKTIRSNEEWIHYGKIVVKDIWRLPLVATDFIRSCGYALPHGNYSVEELILRGVYKV